MRYTLSTTSSTFSQYTLLLVVLLVLSACSTAKKEPEMVDDGLAAPADQVEEGIVEQQPNYVFEKDASKSAKAPLTSRDFQQKRAPSGTVVALLNQAREQQRTGNPERAAAVLERALRIDPKNPGLWSELAQIRLQQGHLSLAKSLATKSNALLNGDDELRQRNDTIIKQVKILRGD